MYDCIIIGAGPAGMTAAIYAARQQLKTLLIGKEPGGQMAWSRRVENYNGFSLISGSDLTLRFEEHLKILRHDLEIKYGTEVTDIERNITSFEVTDSAEQVYYGRTIIIASGRTPRYPGISGEEKLWGKGVAVCTNCDAPLYKDKEVAVIGGSNSAMDAILTLSKIAKRVHSVNLSDELVGDIYLKNKVLSTVPKTEFYNNAKTLEILGDEVVSGIRIQQLGKPEQQISVHGVFIEIGYIPRSSFDRLTEKNSHGEIKVDQNMQTSVPGIFAAGDINDASGEQIIIAAGEGSKAALAACRYVNRIK